MESSVINHLCQKVVGFGVGVGDWGESERAHTNAKSGARMLYYLKGWEVKWSNHDQVWEIAWNTQSQMSEKLKTFLNLFTVYTSKSIWGNVLQDHFAS